MLGMQDLFASWGGQNAKEETRGESQNLPNSQRNSFFLNALKGGATQRGRHPSEIQAPEYRKGDKGQLSGWKPKKKGQGDLYHKLIMRGI